MNKSLWLIGDFWSRKSEIGRLVWLPYFPTRDRLAVFHMLDGFGKIAGKCDFVDILEASLGWLLIFKRRVMASTIQELGVNFLFLYIVGFHPSITSPMKLCSHSSVKVQVLCRCVVTA